MHPERLLCVLLLQLISFVEVPLWCLRHRRGAFEWEVGAHLCRAPGHVYLSGIDYVPVGATVAVELACVGYLALLAGMELGFGRPRDRRMVLRVGATAVLAVDVVLFGATVVGFGGAPSFRLAPYARVALLVANARRRVASLT